MSARVADRLRAGFAHHQAGRLKEAAAAYREILTEDPAHPEGLHLMGTLAVQIGRHDVALDLLLRAIRARPRFAKAHNDLGIAFDRVGRHDEAAGAFAAAIACDPAFAEAQYNLGTIYKKQGRLRETLECFAQALRLRPDFFQAHNNLGNVLQMLGLVELAAERYRLALALKPDSAELHNNVGTVLQDSGDFRDAEAHYRRALSLRPIYLEAHNNLAISLQRQGRYAEAEANFRVALALKPDDGKIRHNLAITLLAAGRFEEGWREYEFRWQCDALAGSRRDFPQPLWTGEPVGDRTLLLHAEQGLGDTLQFIRYAPLVAGRGIRTLIEVPRPVLRLVRAMAIPDATVVEAGTALPPFDLHCPLLSLPRIFGTVMDTIPATVPYLSADPAAIARWGEKLGPGSELKVGLVWAGRRRPQTSAMMVDRRRSMSLAQLAPLAACTGVRFYSLQKGEPAGQRAVGFDLVDWMGEIGDFADTAALIANLDLVISVDTSVAHLAGALGTPVWLLNRFDTCWRWLAERDDSPWYPSLRQFRQAQPGDWDGVVARVAAALAGLVR
jgi:tetratricopeptide (TPR) repeat protein